MSIETILNLKSFKSQIINYGQEGPFDHCVIDNFFQKDIAKNLEKEFPSFNDENLLIYNNAIEKKKTLNNWDKFPPQTYETFSLLNSQQFTDFLSLFILKGTKLYSDPGLNGGGWHMHKKGGKLNTHLDYSLHPKINRQRKLNLIIYLNSAWKEDWGGGLDLLDNKSEEKPGNLIKSISPKFNRAVIFDTTQNSWHGLSKPLECPDNQYRKSLAMYYLCDPVKNVNTRGKALFSPTKDQEDDLKVLSLIKKRSNIKTSSDSYIDK
jgi:Rps23 Pro-64 3,4-dihydroxylase Tpa1-like proline 4-hydroxylase